MRAALLVLATATLLATPARAANLRESTTLSRPEVRLSDLFTVQGNDRVIGPAPEPGGRIVVEAPQLAAIARQFGVDWRPASAADRIVIDRPGRVFPLEQVMETLHSALITAGIPPISEVEMPTYAPPMVPPDGSARSEIDQMEYDPVSGRFTALLSITADGMTPSHARLSGHVQEMVDLVVPTRRMAMGEVIGSGDVQVSRVSAALVRAPVARLPEQVVGMALRRPVVPGAPMVLADIGRAAVVQRGSPVQMELELPGLSVSARGVAMEPGAPGEHIQVMNPLSRAMMDAEVTGPDRVRVSGGNPVLLPPGAAVPQQKVTPAGAPVRVAVR
jgi:flagella basal body P-ring formation protein FlgA